MKILTQNRSEVEQNRDITGIGLKRSKLTLELAERLKTITIASGDKKAALKAEKLSCCGSLSNIYTGIDMHNSDGECFDGVSSLWSCCLAYCQNCVSLKARVRRREMRHIYRQLKPPAKTMWNFVTLTSPSVPVPLLTSFEVYLRAWGLFKDIRWFEKNVWCGWKNIEFTVNEETRLAHVHVHALMLSKFLRPSEVRANWQKSIAKAYRDICGVSLTIPKKGLVIDVKPIEPRKYDEMETAILETAKYTSKGSDWLALPDSDLLAVSQLDRFPRLFSSFGKAHRKSSLNKLDSPVLKGAEKKHRIKLEKPIQSKVNRSRKWRLEKLKLSYPLAQIETLDWLSVPQVKGTPKLKLVKRKTEK